MTINRITIYTFLIAVLLTSSTALANSNNIPQGFSCQTMECKIKIKTLKEYARNGSSYAQEIVATSYLTGQGLKQSPEKAITYFRKSMKQGSGRAAWFLFAMYHYGMGVDKDDQVAKEYLDFAINKKDKAALYYKGASLFIDNNQSQEALNLLTEASELDESNATYLLADYYAQQATNSEKEQGALLFLQLKADNFKDSVKKYNAVMSLLSPHSKTNVFQQCESIERNAISGHKPTIIEQLDTAIASISYIYDSPNSIGTRIRGNHTLARDVNILRGAMLDIFLIGMSL